MDFKPNSSVLERALRPDRIRESTRQWRDILGYTYIIQRYMPMTNEDKASSNLFKIGFSQLNTALGDESKNLARLVGFRTSVLAFAVHRIYLFGRSQLSRDRSDKQEEFSLKAYDFEQAAQRHTEFHLGFKRIKFSNDQKSEWFVIPKTQEERFLSEIDKFAFQITKHTPLAGTKFSRNSAQPITLDPVQRSTGVGYDTEGNLTQRRSSRISNSDFANSLIQRRSDEQQRQFILEEKNLNRAEKLEKMKTVPFWKKLFVGKTFFDKVMYSGDKGKFPNKIIYDVAEVKIGNNWQPVVLYKANVSKTRSSKVKITVEEEEEASGYLTVNEMIDLYFKDLKVKYKDSFEYFQKLNGDSDIYVQDDK